MIAVVMIPDSDRALLNLAPFKMRGQGNSTRPIVCGSDDCALRQSVIGGGAASSDDNVLQITAVEAKLIREFLMKIDAFKPMVEAGHNVGDTIPENRLLDFSALLTQGVPKLKNTNYTTDQNGSITIVSENRIIAILDFINVAR